MTHIRYVHRQLDARQVMEALLSAELHAVIEPGGHKAMQPEQSHGRWQVNGIGFEVHPGYSCKHKEEPDILIVQGRIGWRASILDKAARAISNAPERFSDCVSGWYRRSGRVLSQGGKYVHIHSCH